MNMNDTKRYECCYNKIINLLSKTSKSHTKIVRISIFSGVFRVNDMNDTKNMKKIQNHNNTLISFTLDIDEYRYLIKHDKTSRYSYYSYNSYRFNIDCDMNSDKTDTNNTNLMLNEHKLMEFG